MSVYLTFDVEPDIHTSRYKSIKEGIPRILKLLDKHNIKATFFTTCDCIEKYPKIFQNLKKQGHEIALHGYRHERFDSLSAKEKQSKLKKSILCFKKHLNQKPLGFRSPQHSIDDKTLDLLEKHNFSYDSSYAPLNLLQLLFFPTKPLLWFKQFFSKNKKYNIRNNLYEIPTSALLFPFVSLVFRAFPFWLIKIYFSLLKLSSKNQVFYAHSWDFIDVSGKIASIWPKEKLIKNLDLFLSYYKNNKFERIRDSIK